MINELIETTGINHVEVIQTLVIGLEQDEARWSRNRSYVWEVLGTAV